MISGNGAGLAVELYSENANGSLKSLASFNVNNGYADGYVDYARNLSLGVESDIVIKVTARGNASNYKIYIA